MSIVAIAVLVFISALSWETYWEVKKVRILLEEKQRYEIQHRSKG
jgi:hypothetical protein